MSGLPESGTALREARIPRGPDRLGRAAVVLHFTHASSPAEIMGSPLPFSLGPAKVREAYRDPGGPVIAERLVSTGLMGRLAIPMGDRPGREGPCAASGKARSSSTGTETNSLA